MNIKSLKKLEDDEIKNILNFEKYLIESSKPKQKKIKEKIDISNSLIKEFEFLKTTGIHIPKGVILYENINSL